MPDAATDSQLDSLVERALSRLAERDPAALADPARRARLARLALCSDFAIDTLCRQPELAATLGDDRQADWAAQAERVILDVKPDDHADQTDRSRNRSRQRADHRRCSRTELERAPVFACRECPR